jgi:hypothetical protein
MDCAPPVQKANGVQFLVGAKNADFCEMCAEYPRFAQQNLLDVCQWKGERAKDIRNCANDQSHSFHRSRGSAAESHRAISPSRRFAGVPENFHGFPIGIKVWLASFRPKPGLYNFQGGRL